MIDIEKKGFHERFHIDDKGRRWNFVQKDSPLLHLPWLFWVCTVCQGEELVQYEHIVHDEVVVKDPTDQLNQHDCDVEHCRQVLQT
jgi:hypothetical protein